MSWLECTSIPKDSLILQESRVNARLHNENYLKNDSNQTKINLGLYFVTLAWCKYYLYYLVKN